MSTQPKKPDDKSQLLMDAVRRGHVSEVQHLLNGRADANSCNADNIAALSFAVATGEREIAIALMDARADLNAADLASFTPLHHAILGERLDMVKVLLEKKADVLRRNVSYQTPYAYAQSRGCNKIAALLREQTLEAERQEKIKTELSTLFLKLAGEGEQRAAEVQEILKKFTNDEHKNEVFFMAAKLGNVPAVKILLEAKASPNMSKGWALYIAAAGGHAEVVKVLLAAGANVETESPVSKHPVLCVASLRGHVSVVTALLEAKANPEGHNSNKETALSAAISKKDIVIMTALLEAKANIDAPRGPKHEPALHTAIKSGQFERVKILLDAKADLEAVSEGMTPLLTAAAFCLGNEKNRIITALLEAKANMRAHDSSGKTALHLLCSQRNAMSPSQPDLLKPMIKLLLDAKADAVARDNFKKRAHEYLKENGIACPDELQEKVVTHDRTVALLVALHKRAGANSILRQAFNKYPGIADVQPLRISLRQGVTSPALKKPDEKTKNNARPVEEESSSCVIS